MQQRSGQIVVKKWSKSAPGGRAGAVYRDPAGALEALVRLGCGAPPPAPRRRRAAAAAASLAVGGGGGAAGTGGAGAGAAAPWAARAEAAARGIRVAPR